MKHLKVYPARPISGCTGEEVVEYYNSIRDTFEEMGYEVFSPMNGKGKMRTELEFKAHGYEGNPVTTNHAIIERDKWMVSHVDIVFVNLLECKRVSIGTVMEMAWAHQLGKHTVTVMEDDNIHRHAFVLEASDIVFNNLDDAMNYMAELSV